MSKHTPEPWGIDCEEGISETKICSPRGTSGYHGLAVIIDDNSEAEANAERIVACVNALAGIGKPEEWVSHAKAAEKHRHEIAAHQDDLDDIIKAAKAMRRSSLLAGYDWSDDEYVAPLDAAIRKFDPTWRGK